MFPASEHAGLSACARLLLISVVALPCFAAVAQPESGPTNREIQDAILDEIYRQGFDDDPDSPELIEPLTRLGLAYREQGDLIEAEIALQQALQIVRINFGLYTLDQAAILRQLIEIQDARGNASGAWSLEQELLDLARRFPDDPRTVKIYADAATTRFDAVDAYLDGQYPPEIELGCYFNKSAVQKGCAAGSQRVAIGAMLAEAHEYYEDAIYLILRRGDYANPELYRLESMLLRSSYVNGRWIIPEGFHTGSPLQSRFDLRETGYSIGVRSLSRLISYAFVREAPLLERMSAIVGLADWQLLFAETNKQRESVLETYRYVYEQLVQNGAAQTSIDAIFSPDTPVLIPSFMPNPLSSAAESAASAYLDIRFEITRLGASQRLELADRGDTPKDLQSQLARRILGGTFRPRVVDGRFAKAVPVEIRYYVTE